MIFRVVIGMIQQLLIAMMLGVGFTQSLMIVSLLTVATMVIRYLTKNLYLTRGIHSPLTMIHAYGLSCIFELWALSTIFTLPFTFILPFCFWCSFIFALNEFLSPTRGIDYGFRQW